MTSCLVVCLRETEAHRDAQRHFRAGTWIHRRFVQGEGGQLIAWSSDRVSYCLDPKSVASAVDAAHRILSECSTLAVGIAFGDLEEHPHEEDSSTFVWGPALIDAEALAEAAGPAQILADASIESVQNEWTTASTIRHVQAGEERLSALVLGPGAGSEIVQAPGKPDPTLPSQQIPTRIQKPEVVPMIRHAVNLTSASIEGAKRFSDAEERPRISSGQETQRLSNPPPKPGRTERLSNPPPKPQLGERLSPPGRRTDAGERLSNPPPKPKRAASSSMPEVPELPRVNAGAVALSEAVSKEGTLNDEAVGDRVSSPPPKPATAKRVPRSGASLKPRLVQEAPQADVVPDAEQELPPGPGASEEGDASEKGHISADRGGSVEGETDGPSGAHHHHGGDERAAVAGEGKSADRPSVTDALRSGNPVLMRDLAEQLRCDGGQKPLVDRLLAMATLASGDFDQGLLELRHAVRSAEENQSPQQGRAVLALAVGLALAGRREEARQEAENALDRSKQQGDGKGEYASRSFLRHLDAANEPKPEHGS